MPEKPFDWLINPFIFRFEWSVLLSAVLISLIAWHYRPFRALNLRAKEFSRDRRAAIISVMLLAGVGRLLLMPLLGFPKAGIADEFGYLLSADTFLHGRLTNPTHSMWIHFETFNVFHIPTYQSQYPFGSSAVLALAKLALGHCWWGVFLITVLLCGAVVWALQAWVPPYWAWVAGIFVALRIGLFHYWMNSYWGGSLAALGGVMVMGSLPRLAGFGRKDAWQPRHVWRNAYCAALGLAILACTRPFEGLLLSLPLGTALLWRLWKASERRTMRRVLAATATVLVPLFAFTLYYQWRVTGKAFKSPYAVTIEQYYVSQPFIWQQPLPVPKYRHLELRRNLVNFQTQKSERNKYLLGYFEATQERFVIYWACFVGPLLSLVFLFGYRALLQRKMQLLWAAGWALIAGLAVQNWIQAHYLAPGFLLIVLFLLQGGRYLRALRWHRLGQKITRPMLVAAVVLVIARAAFFNREVDFGPWPPSWAFRTMNVRQRDRFEEKIAPRPGKQLVIVHYNPAFHVTHDEWVFNMADLDNEKIVWARSMDAKNNCELAHYYRGREIWLVKEAGAVVESQIVPEEEICDLRLDIYKPAKPASVLFPEAFKKTK